MQDFPSVTRFMATKLITFAPDMDILDAMDLLLKKKITGAPVLNKQGELVGMLSEVDCLKLLVEGPYNQEPNSVGTVADFMSKEVVTIDHDRTILDAAYTFVNSGLKRLPVRDDNNKLIGQISRVDVLRAIQKTKPFVRHVPDSWKKRVPAMPNYKKSRHSENS
jgi:predicted transcriptional regulator